MTDTHSKRVQEERLFSAVRSTGNSLVSLVFTIDNGKARVSLQDLFKNPPFFKVNLLYKQANEKKSLTLAPETVYNEGCENFHE
jgi:hypothetical protein